MGELADEGLRRLGVELKTGHRVDAVDNGSAAGEGFALRADLVLLGLGTTPEAELAQAAGIELGATGAVAVNQYQETSQPGVWAAGDCAEATHRVSGQQVNIASRNRG